ncbi:DUF4381 domain-containing protein [Culicoidibacter larvae]|uniref:DUF4381 domain-containing protein n=1 Tax=Culicoidibacter larvae TaxID=2579976 RepID=A0A5R8QBC0_9FIRM|nr:DUF4381 domain-containing protein [Culicoidibacter larvae]TLG73838.1 DUF4381 domain-containing protein [Culicoidibacter larvae]
MFGSYEVLLIIGFVLVILVAVTWLIHYNRRRRQARVLARITQNSPWPIFPATITAARVINDFQVQVSFFITLKNGKQIYLEDVFGISEFMVMRTLAIEYDEVSGSYQFVDDLAVLRVEDLPVLQVGARVLAVNGLELEVETRSIFPLRLAVPVSVEQRVNLGDSVMLQMNPVAPLKAIQLMTDGGEERQ